MKELADMGCWTPDVLNSSEERQTGLLTGRTATMTWNLGSCGTYGKQANQENPDWNITIIDPVASMPKKVNSYINNGVAINVNSQKKERAMMALNEFYTNPEVYDTAMFGIEGKHWTAIGDDQYQSIDPTNYGVNNNCNWGWNNTSLKRTEFIENRTALDDRCEELEASFNANIKASHVYDGFNFDSTQVSTQFAAVEVALSNYYKPLTNGLVEDVDAAIKSMASDLESAGIRDVLAEMERQAAEFIAEK